MTRELTNGSERERRLNEVLLAFVEAAQAGRPPDRREVLAAHPDLRAELEEFFAGHDAVERLAEPLREAAREGLFPTEDPGHDSVRGDEPSAPGPCSGAAGGAAAELGQLGDFRLLREVGRGGMGVVYEAEQISLRRRVALKVLPFAAAIDPRQLQRFRNEALAAAHLRHENVVPVYAVGCERGVHYYAMQFVEGQSLAALIGELRRLGGASERQPHAAPPRPGAASETTGPYFRSGAAETPSAGADRDAAASLSRERSSGSRRYYNWVAGLGRQAALALEHAHQAGVIHRDVKPANLLLDPQGQLWVTDFGLAQVSSDAGLTVTGELLGTLRYASPEQALARPGLVDHRSDIYSLGATLYELLTLRPIFDGRDRHELLRQIANDEPLAPRSVDQAIPAELETVILKAIAKDPGDRYASARELADDLQRYLEDRPIRARRPSPLEKAIKWARRHKSVVASAVAALLLSVAGLSAATVLTARAYDRERRKAAEADESFREARRAVDQFAKIGEEELAGNPNPQVQGLRRRLLEAALAYYQDFLDQRRDDPSTRADLQHSRDRAVTIIGELTTMMGADQYRLLREGDVRKDLQLTEAQQKELVQHDCFSFEPKGGEPAPEPERPDSVEREKRFLALVRAQEAEAARVLTRVQLRRLKQIALQQRGPLAFSDPDVVASLGLTAAQTKKVREIQDEASHGGPGRGRRGGPGFEPRGDEPNFGPRGRGRRGPPDGPDGRWRSQQGIAQEKILALLTPEQKHKWEELTGKPFQGEIRFGPPPGPPR
jgi:serine/threonine protein kinase